MSDHSNFNNTDGLDDYLFLLQRESQKQEAERKAAQAARAAEPVEAPAPVSEPTEELESVTETEPESAAETPEEPVKTGRSAPTMQDGVAYNPGEPAVTEVGGRDLLTDVEPDAALNAFVDDGKDAEPEEGELTGDQLRKKFSVYTDPDDPEDDDDEDDGAEDDDFALDENDDDDGETDFDDGEPAEKKTLRQRFADLSKSRKIILVTALVLVVLLAAAAIVGGVFISHKLSIMGDSFDTPLKPGETVPQEKEPDDIAIDIGGEGFRNALKQWAQVGNDAKLSSKDVLNVLLIGCDEGGGNTDAMLLVSLNKKTKKITMVSFLRDSYLYVENGDDSHCTKLNAAYSMAGGGDAGAKKLMETIENNYKIKIDNYALVNFDSFKALVDAMGGITADVPDYVADYINHLWWDCNMPYGEDVTLNGYQALCFCRARHCYNDADVSRAKNQRAIINKLLTRAQSGTLSELNTYVNTLLPYVLTGYSAGELVSLGTTALTKNWVGFDRAELQMPTPETRAAGSEDMWIWVIDYKTAAHTLQEALYGKSNIILEEGEQTLIDVYNSESGTGVAPEPAAVEEEEPADEPETEAVETPVAEEPVAEEPAEEAPAGEEPAGEEPVEEPAPEEPAEEPADEPETPDETEAPATEEPATEEPATEAPATEEPATEAPAEPDAPAEGETAADETTPEGT